MATVAEPRRVFDRADTQRRVRHPLDALRGYIRRYVVLEGLAVAVLFLAGWFWIGLALDFGSFKLWAFDWIQELQEATLDATTGKPGNLDTVVRVGLLIALIACLVGLVAWKVFFRLFREFSDRSLALVLERRYRRELGDRLITAVELADPKENEKFGYSPALVEKTIMDAADRVEKLPVSEVFDWARLRRLWLWAALASVGVYLLVGLGSVVYGAVSGGSASPFDFAWRFHDVASIWTERNIMLQNSYWPRSAYLQVVGIPETADHTGTLRVPRDEQRPEILVRAVNWVVTDPASHDGWRPLKWSDAGAFVSAEQLAKVNIPVEFDAWIMDFDDLTGTVPAGIIPASWQGKTSGAIRQELALAQIRAAYKHAQAEAVIDEQFERLFFNGKAGAEGLRVIEAGAVPDINHELDWHNWTVDKLALQYAKASVLDALRKEKLNSALESVLDELTIQAESARMSRRLRKLNAPGTVTVYFRGDNTKLTNPRQREADNRFTVPLNELKESARLTVRGDDYYTRPRRIILVPPPGVSSMTIDKEEPAYIYYRLQGDQMPLKDKRQIFKNYPVSVDGDSSSISVPIGTSLVIRAKTDRPLKDGIHVRAPARSEEVGALLPESPVKLSDDRMEFSIQIERVVRPYDFFVEFNDTDNVRGWRRIKITPRDDRAPEVFDLELATILRKARFKSEPTRTTRGVRPDGFLITPNALLPFKGSVKDDYGLTQIVWAFDVEQVYFELMGGGSSGGPAKKDGDKIDPALRDRISLIVAGLQFTPGSVAHAASGRLFGEYARLSIGAEIDKNLIPRENEKEVVMTRWKEYLDAHDALPMDKGGAIPLTALADLLKKPAPTPNILKSHQLKDEEGFDVFNFAPSVRQKEGVQFHYMLEVGVKATDNNVDNGPNIGRPKSGVSFLIVSELELLSQIGVEEEVLLDRLEKVYSKLQSAHINMEEQIKKLSIAAPDLSLVSLRVEGVRKDLLDSASTCREIANDYTRILRELEVNRVVKDKIDEVRDKIVAPLNEIVHGERGHFALTETQIQKLYQALDDDLAAKRGDENRVSHLTHAKLTDEHLLQLMTQIKLVIDQMDQGVDFTKALNALVAIEAEQRRISEIVQRWYLYIADQTFRDLNK